MKLPILILSSIFTASSAHADWPTLDWKTLSVANVEGVKKIDSLLFRDDKKFITDSLLVVKNGRLVYERYARGYNKSMRHIAWSISKTFTSALLAIAIDRKLVSLEDPVSKFVKYDVQDSKSQERFKKLTIRHLVEMSSGFDWDETYGNPASSDVVAMLYFPMGYKAQGEFALTRKMTADPGTKFLYSTGETNLLMNVLRKAIPAQEYDEFPFKNLFEKIGMTSAVWERDQSGMFVGGSYVYATPRDLLKFGFLLLHEGEWDGRQIFSKEWVKYARTPSNSTKILSDHDNQPYGGHLWLNTKNSYYPNKSLPDAPESMFMPLGHQGQWLMISPEQDMLILRMGEDNHPGLLPTLNMRNELVKTALEVFK